MGKLRLRLIQFLSIRALDLGEQTGGSTAA